MPRKATKSASASASRSSSKRPAPEVPARQSKRARATVRKSYVEPESDTDNEGDKAKKVPLASDDDDDGVASDYKEHSDKDPSSESEHDETASDDDSESKRANPRGGTIKDLAIHKKVAAEKEPWKPGAKLAPGTQLVIKKPKARDAGDTPYLDHTIHPNTMLFLKDLAANNDRQWLKLHDPDFRVSFQDFTTFTEKVSEKIIEADETIPELPVKNVVSVDDWVIVGDTINSHRSTEFTETYFSAAWSRTGRKGPYAHYYIQVQPNGGSFVGGGFWQPDATTLAKLRRDIDRKPHKIKAVLTNPSIREAFLGGVKNDEKKAVKAFTNLSMNKSNALKRNPKGYDHDHKDIDLLRLRNFTMGQKLADEEIVGNGGLQRVGELVASMVPFITYLNNIAMPDDDTSASSDDDGSAAERDNDSGAAEDDEA